MLDRTEAAERAREYLSGLDEPVALRDDETVEEDFGWVFFYASTDPSVVLAGNAPLVVLRDTGEVRVTGTALPLVHYLAPIRTAWNAKQ